MVQVKGSTLVPRLQYLEKNASPEKKQAVLATLSPDFQKKIADNMLFQNEWYPLAFFVSLNRALDAVLGTGDLSLIPVVAAYSAEQSLTTIYKVFYKIGSPDFIIKRASLVWNQYYSSGKLETLQTHPKEVKITLLDFETPAREHCLSVQGWIQKTLEMSGGHRTKVEHVQCRTRGQNACVFQAKWE